MRGICGCVTGPPPGGICNACGAWGVGYNPPYGVPAQPPPNAPVVPYAAPGPIQFIPAPLTADEVRKIVREELERALSAQGKTAP
jgi:hypothetical protein